MGLFRKSDELFEIMSKRGQEPGQSGSGPGPRLSGSNPRPSEPRGGFVRPFETTVGFGRSSIFGRSGGLERDYLNVDGETVVVVEDGFELLEGEGESRQIAIRPDTLVVGALLATGLLIGAFLLGRTTGGGETAPSVAAASEEPAAEEEAAPAQPEAPAQAAAAAPAPATIGAPAPLGGAPAQPAAQPQQPTTLAASAPAPKGRYELIVASTTPESAKRLVDWFQKDPASPLAGRKDLRVVCSSRGRVSILGFEKTDSALLKKVRQTNDPLGGSGSFHDAFFKRAKK